MFYLHYLHANSWHHHCCCYRKVSVVVASGHHQMYVDSVNVLWISNWTHFLIYGTWGRLISFHCLYLGIFRLVLILVSVLNVQTFANEHVHPEYRAGKTLTLKYPKVFRLTVIRSQLLHIFKRLIIVICVCVRVRVWCTEIVKVTVRFPAIVLSKIPLCFASFSR